MHPRNQARTTIVMYDPDPEHGKSYELRLKTKS